MRGLRERYPGALIERAPRERGIGSAARRARRGGYALAIAIYRSPGAALIPFLARIPFRIGPGSRAGRLFFSIAVPFEGGEGPRGGSRRILALLDPHVEGVPAAPSDVGGTMAPTRGARETPGWAWERRAQGGFAA